MNWRRRKFLGAYYEAWLWAALFLYGYLMGMFTS